MMNLWNGIFLISMISLTLSFSDYLLPYYVADEAFSYLGPGTSWLWFLYLVPGRNGFNSD